MNGFNLGRYWPVRGPQITLFVPSGVLRPYPQTNSLMIVELQWAPCPQHCQVRLTDTPILNGPVTQM